MRHEKTDDLGLSTNELICVLMRRVDCSRSLFALLALIVEESSARPIGERIHTAEPLRDAADAIEKGDK